MDEVTTLARGVVEACAPEELPFFAAASAAYFRDPRRALAGRKRSDEVLGSGLDTAVALLSPVALAVAAAVYEAGARDEDDVRAVVARRAAELGLAPNQVELVADAVLVSLSRNE
ncbi:hypothetical protein NLX83_19025 [Allokutzneria sp. A3M-2-11 16]|uniref:hypothetical protein n=1 Tax=Allokutzneria sp. A3M-2-11 16 TaxID=2962043 RepID=UPI0020B7F63F|nr:hypothetical protein [Allokutzneria sp. A3M-2-11 16]MCP3801358.1 hypothetical protein [Allokutzneria sp. A3M-2-11 16]